MSTSGEYSRSRTRSIVVYVRALVSAAGSLLMTSRVFAAPCRVSGDRVDGVVAERDAPSAILLVGSHTVDVGLWSDGSVVASDHRGSIDPARARDVQHRIVQLVRGLPPVMSVEEPELDSTRAERGELTIVVRDATSWHVVTVDHVALSELLADPAALHLEDFGEAVALLVELEGAATVALPAAFDVWLDPIDSDEWPIPWPNALPWPRDNHVTIDATHVPALDELRAHLRDEHRRVGLHGKPMQLSITPVEPKIRGQATLDRVVGCVRDAAASMTMPGP